ncbi:uncharacterized protein LOC144715894 [Wolffia australiana]
MKTIDASLESVPFGGKVILMGEALYGAIALFFTSKPTVTFRSTNKLGTSSYLSAEKGCVGPDVHLPTEIQRVSSLSEMIAQVYGTFEDGATQSIAKTILIPLNDDVVKVNNMVLNVFPGEEMEYFSFDAIPPGKVDNESLYPTKFLNTIDGATMPLHKLRLKIGCIVILL